MHSRNAFRHFAASVALLVVLTACGSATPTPVFTATPTAVPTAAPTPTAIPIATATAPSSNPSATPVAPPAVISSPAGAAAAPPPDTASGVCDNLPVDRRDGTDGSHIASVEVPSIPYPSGERPSALVYLVSELTNGPSDRSTAEQLARADRASRSTLVSTLDRWAVIAAAGQYRAFFAQIFEAVSGDPPQVNPVAQYLCKLSPSRAQLATVYASFHAFDGSAYYNSEWTAEDGHSITDANTGQVIVSGPGGSGPLADVPFEPGVATDAWLLTNINARNLAVTCQNLRPDVSAWGDGAIAQVGCGGSGAYSALNYVLYNSGLTLQTYWNKRAEQVNNTFTLATDVCGAGNTWIYANNNADPKGSLMCERGVEQTGAAFAQIEWTEDDWRIGAFVRTNGDIATLWALWTQASSLPRTP